MYTLSGLSSKSVAEIVLAVKGIAEDEISAIMSVNFLGRRSSDALKIIFAALPATVMSLDLSVNLLCIQSGASLAIVFASIPRTVTSLNLCGNYLFEYKSGADLALAFAGIPAGIRSLGLSYNELLRSSVADIAIALAGIPRHVKSLDLRGSNLGDSKSVSIEVILRIIASIPAHITELDLSENLLDCRSAEDIRRIAAATPVGLKLNWGFDASHILILPVKASEDDVKILHRLPPLSPDKISAGVAVHGIFNTQRRHVVSLSGIGAAHPSA